MDGLLVGMAMMLSGAVHPAPAVIFSPAPVSLERAAVAAAKHSPILLVRTPSERRQVSRPMGGDRFRGGRLPNVVIGAIAGLIAGAYVGHEMTRDCVCDSPGLQGVIIGAPVGAALGAVLAWNLGR